MHSKEGVHYLGGECGLLQVFRPNKALLPLTHVIYDSHANTCGWMQKGNGVSSTKNPNMEWLQLVFPAQIISHATEVRSAPVW